MNTNTQPLSAAQVGAELEQAYARQLGWRVNGGFGDGGRDLVGPMGEAIQVKSSVHHAIAFVRESLRRREFIPVVVGEPGERSEMLESIKKFGAWINPGLRRQHPGFLAGMQQLRTMLMR